MASDFLKSALGGAASLLGANMIDRYNKEQDQRIRQEDMRAASQLEEESYMRREKFLRKLNEADELKKVSKEVVDEEAGIVRRYNARGEELASRPISSTEAADIKTTRSTNDAQRRSAIAAADSAEYGNSERARQMEYDKTYSMVDANSAQADYYRMGGSQGRQRAKDPQQVYSRAYGAIIKSVEDAAKLGDTSQNQIAQEALQFLAEARRKDDVDTMEQILNLYLQKIAQQKTSQQVP